MRYLTFVLLLLVVASAEQSRAQECRGDLNGSGQTDVSDAIAVVNEILYGCGAPQPGCPLNFRTDTLDHDLCSFVGPFSTDLGCNADLIGAVFAVSGTAVAIGLTTSPIVIFGATAATGTTASLFGWSTNGFVTYTPATGTVRLGSAGDTLNVLPTSPPPFTIDGCRFTGFRGAYQSGDAAFDLGSRSAIDRAALTRLRALVGP